MSPRAFILTLLAAAWTAAAPAAQWEVVLLKPAGCNLCTFVEEILKRSAQLREVVLDDGAGGEVTAQIQRRTSPELSAQEWAELRALPGFDEPLWRQRAAARSAQVLLKRDGTIVSAGDITDSSDLRGARLPTSVTTPDIGRDPGSVRNLQSGFVTDLFLRSWNLDWFYRLALDPTLVETRSDASWIAANPGTLSPPLGAANVLLMSTASGAADNEIFNALRIEEIRSALTQWLSLDAAQLRIFYGDGNERGANALEVRDGRVGLVRRTVAGASPFTPEAALRIFHSIRERPGSRNLLVLIGHGNPDGAGMWSSPAPLSPAALRSLHEHGGGDDVLVSGNCYGGVMARATSCGFFGARPDIVATGCQADAAVVAQSRDYLHMFFSGLAPAMAPSVDADGDGAVTFAEAHWYASTEGDPRNVTYTSIDALADDWYAQHRDTLPRSLTVREILALAEQAAPAEARALRRLVGSQQEGLVVSLEDPAAQAMSWRPESGAPRALLAQLTRRVLFLGREDHRDQEVTQLQSCENRSIAEFLGH